MLKKFRTKDLVVCALFGAMIFVMGLALGAVIITITGIPATGSLLNMFFAVLIGAIGIKIVNKFGAATFIVSIEGILTVPTIINGPPGVQKILIMFVLGLTIDIILYLTKRSNKGFILAGAATGVLAVLLIFLSLIFLGLPEAKQLQAILIPLIGINALLGITGTYLGLWLFDKKLKDKAFIKQLQT